MKESDKVYHAIGVIVNGIVDMQPRDLEAIKYLINRHETEKLLEITSNNSTSN